MPVPKKTFLHPGQTLADHKQNMVVQLLQWVPLTDIG